jgi:uncharacterized membrane protein (UPF0127 family)
MLTLRSIIRRLSRQRAAMPPMRAVNLTRQTELASLLAVAATSATRRKGLLGRTGLEPGEGLWILPCEAVHSMGMQFAIDLIYLDRQKRAIKLRHGMVPRRLSACLRAHSVLELPAGSIRRTQTQPGDVIQIEPLAGASESQKARE